METKLKICREPDADGVFHFAVPQLSVNYDTWGPTRVPEQFKNVPYAPFGKGDRLGTAADFSAGSERYYRRKKFLEKKGRNEVSEINDEFQFRHDKGEEASFSLVDSSKGNMRRAPFRKSWLSRKKMQDKAWEQQKQRQESNKLAFSGKAKHGTANSSHGKRWQRLNRARQASQIRRPKGQEQNQRKDSVKVAADWEVIEQFDLSTLTKLFTKVPEAEDLYWCGRLDEYNDAYDRITTKTAKKLQRHEKSEFYYVTTTEDPIIEKLAMEKAGNVFATDSIMGLLMSASRSVYPWDIIIEKAEGTMFFDKREDSDFDLLSVSETARTPPADDDSDSINVPYKLSLEATAVNQNFSQQILNTDKPAKKIFDNPNPFFDEEENKDNGMKPASGAFRYRSWQLGEGIKVVARCEIHGIVSKQKEDRYINAYALNEWDSNMCQGIDWRKKIDTQRGAVLATELKNNSCKLARWTAQTLLSGALQMELGYVSREKRSNSYSHVILATQFYKPREFAHQITLDQKNMWGIMKMIIELIQGQPDGKYVCMKDPNKPIIRIYKVPADAFEDEEEN